MNVCNRISAIQDYLTATKELTIISAETRFNESDFNDYEKEIVIKFQTDDGIIFTQKFKTEYEEDLHRIIETINLDKECNDIVSEDLIDKRFKAVIATKKNWKRAFIVASF